MLRKSKKKKEKSLSQLMQLADKLHSLKVRQKGMDGDGMQRCYTCGIVRHWKKMHCSHYLSRFYKAARWDDDNTRPACPMCNLWKRGDPIRFRENLIREIGEARVLAVERKRGVSLKLTREYLTNLIQSLQ